VLLFFSSLLFSFRLSALSLSPSLRESKRGKREAERRERKGRGRD